MNPSLIYLHIPKSAGTSHRAYLTKVYGEDGIFWYGLHSDSEVYDRQEIEGAAAIGGHKPLTFYPSTLPALFTSVVRNPIDRAVSFFNYCTAPPNDLGSRWSEQRSRAQEAWLEKGIDPTSFSRSVENCEAFRVEISNTQCGYLSRYGATFSGVMQTLQEENFVIGVFEDLDKFNGFFREELGFAMDNRARANMGNPGYSQEILKEPGLIELILSLNTEDEVLYNFLRLAYDGLYVGADNVEEIKASVPSLTSRSNLGAANEALKLQSVHLYGKGILKLDEDRTAHAALAVRNTTNRHMMFSKEESSPMAVGWRVRGATGQLVDTLGGVFRLDLTIPAHDTRIVMVPVSFPDSDQDKISEELYLEFSLMNEGEWISDTWPLSAAWTKLYV